MISTLVSHLPPARWLNVMMTLLGRASGGTGKRETSTAHEPNNTEAAGAFETATEDGSNISAAATARLFITSALAGCLWLEVAAARMSAMGRNLPLDQPHCAHARAALGADDDVVVDGDFHVAAGVYQVAGQADVLAGRGGVAARVIVDDDEGRGAQGDGARDDFADVDGGFVD